jgi:nucleotide-binding universal stress UspA family protein
MTFRKILCPIDFSPGSQQAMRVAVRLANQAETELVLVHSCYQPMAFTGQYAVPPPILEELADEARSELDSAVREATELGAKRVTSQLVTGLPWQAIVEVAQQDPTYDLIVVGTHGRSGLARVLLGSVAEKVVRHAPCSVVAVHPSDDPKRFARVLCPVDFSDSSEYAVEIAAAVVDPDGAGITLLHIVELASAYFEAPKVEKFLRELDARSAAMLDEWAARTRTKVTAPVTTRMGMGNVGEQLLATLDDEPTFDLVVTGSHGRTGLKRAFLGSIAEKIVRHAKCPVLVARKRA